MLALAGAVERRSEHPIAQAIVDYAETAGVDVPFGVDVLSLPGRGAEGRVEGAAVVLGNHQLFEERGLCSPLVHERVRQLGDDGRTAVLVASDGDRGRASSRSPTGRARTAATSSICCGARASSRSSC